MQCRIMSWTKAASGAKKASGWGALKSKPDAEPSAPDAPKKNDVHLDRPKETEWPTGPPETEWPVVAEKSNWVAPDKPKETEWPTGPPETEWPVVAEEGSWVAPGSGVDYGSSSGGYGGGGYGGYGGATQVWGGGRQWGGDWGGNDAWDLYDIRTL